MYFILLIIIINFQIWKSVKKTLLMGCRALLIWIYGCNRALHVCVCARDHTFYLYIYMDIWICGESVLHKYQTGGKSLRVSSVYIAHIIHRDRADADVCHHKLGVRKTAAPDSNTHITKYYVSEDGKCVVAGYTVLAATISTVDSECIRTNYRIVLIECSLLKGNATTYTRYLLVCHLLSPFTCYYSSDASKTFICEEIR